jgi:hypothetical protein
MSVHDLLVSYALLGLPVGLATGLGLGLVARREGGWGGYASFRRRATRLGHVALVMLPLIAGFYALTLDGAALAQPCAAWAARLWVVGGVLLPLALYAAGWLPRLTALVAPPALCLVAASALFAFVHLSGWRSP